MADIRTSRTEVKMIWQALADDTTRDEWADSLFNILTMVITGGCADYLTLMLTSEELKVWHEYAVKALPSSQM